MYPLQSLQTPDVTRILTNLQHNIRDTTRRVWLLRYNLSLNVMEQWTLEGNLTMLTVCLNARSLVLMKLTLAEIHCYCSAPLSPIVGTVGTAGLPVLLSSITTLYAFGILGNISDLL